MNSDHSPIKLTLTESIITKENSPTLVNKAADWESFKQKLEGKINLSLLLRNEQQLDKEVEIFTNNIQQAAWETMPVVKRRTTGNNYPKEISDLIEEKEN